MAIRTSGGHGTTSVIGGHGGNYVKAAAPPFQHNNGAAGYNGVGGPKGSFKMSGGGKKKIGSSAPNKSTTSIVKGINK